MGVSDASYPSPKLQAKGDKACPSKKAFKAKPSFPRERKRTIRFNFEKNKTMEYTKYTPTDKSLLWWSRDERSDILEDNRSDAEAFRYCHHDQVQHCMDVYEQCCDEDAPFEELTKQVKIELPVHIRGLEWCILPASKKYRRVHAQRVLKIQEDILSNGKKGTGMNDLILGNSAVESSRPSRIMARIVGESDHSAVKEQPLTRRNRCRMLPSWW